MSRSVGDLVDGEFGERERRIFHGRAGGWGSFHNSRYRMADAVGFGVEDQGFGGGVTGQGE